MKGEEVKVTSTATTSDVEALRATSKEFMELFNPMDAFALFFLSGVADEQVGFAFTGAWFCDSVRSYLPEVDDIQEGRI